MFDKNKKPESPSLKLFDQKLKKIEEAKKHWKKINKYVKPFISNSDIEESFSELNTYFLMAPMDEILQGTMFAAETISMNFLKPKTYCDKCQKEILQNIIKDESK